MAAFLYILRNERYTLSVRRLFLFNGLGCVLQLIDPPARRPKSMMIEFSIVPLGKGSSVSPVIARVMKIVVESGVRY